MERLKEFSFYVLVGYGLVASSIWLESKFLLAFLSEDLIVLLIAVMAINTTTSSVVMTKLKEISEKSAVDFSRTIGQLRLSVIEQICYVIIALVGSICFSSKVINDVFPATPLVIGGLLASVFVASVSTLYDTAQSIFVILKFENKR